MIVTNFRFRGDFVQQNQFCKIKLTSLQWMFQFMEVDQKLKQATHEIIRNYNYNKAGELLQQYMSVNPYVHSFLKCM